MRRLGDIDWRSIDPNREVSDDIPVAGGSERVTLTMAQWRIVYSITHESKVPLSSVVAKILDGKGTLTFEDGLKNYLAGWESGDKAPGRTSPHSKFEDQNR